MAPNFKVTFHFESNDISVNVDLHIIEEKIFSPKGQTT